jgi:hypothetical protein
MMGRKTAQNMQSFNTNKIGTQCVCWFYSQGRKIHVAEDKMTSEVMKHFNMQHWTALYVVVLFDDAHIHFGF